MEAMTVTFGESAFLSKGSKATVIKYTPGSHYTIFEGRTKGREVRTIGIDYLCQFEFKMSHSYKAKAEIGHTFVGIIKVLTGPLVSG